MARCSICDYAEGLGSDYLGIRPSYHIRVSFSPVHGDYICSNCAQEINDANGDWYDEYDEDVDLEDFDDDFQEPSS